MSLPPTLSRLGVLPLAIVQIVLICICFANHAYAAQPSIGGFALGMTLAEVETVLEGYARKGVEIKRTQFGRPSTAATPASVATAVVSAKVGAECSGPRGGEACEQVTVIFVRPDLGGKVRKVESEIFPAAGTELRQVVERLQRTHGPATSTRTFQRKNHDGVQQEFTGLLWGGNVSLADIRDPQQAISGFGDKPIGGTYLYAELLHSPDNTVARVRVTADDHDLSERQAALWAAEQDVDRALERTRWQQCVAALGRENPTRPDSPVKSSEETRVFGYRGLGRVRFTIPAGMTYTPAVPHFTAGTRLIGGEGCREQFEVNVHAHREPQTPEKWRTELGRMLRGSVPVETLASNNALVYATRTDARAGAEYRFSTYGVLAAGRALIRFEHFSNEDSHAGRERLLRLVASAEFLDSDKWASWDQLARDEETLKAAEDASLRKAYGESYGLLKQVCEQWTAVRGDSQSRAAAGYACESAAILLLTDKHAEDPRSPYAATRVLLERALMVYGTADEFKETRQGAYSNLAVVHGLGLGVAEDLALARSYYAKEGTLESILTLRSEGKVGPRTTALLKKLGY